jgi:murein DD-endopeptidase MepM/ murein hydrolase activator NlpD
VEKTQNIFEKVRERLKKHHYNWSTDADEVERAELIERNHDQLLSNDKKWQFKMRGSAIVVCTFLVLVGAGVVDLQTRAYEVFYKGASIGYVESIEAFEAAVSDADDGKSVRRNGSGSDYEIRMARTTEFLTAAEITEVIRSIRAEEQNAKTQVQVARTDNVPPNVTVAPQEQSLNETAQVQTASTALVVEEEPVPEPVSSSVSAPETQTAAASDIFVAEAPAIEADVAIVDAPEAETPQIETIVAGVQSEQNPAAAPVEENQPLETPAVEPQVPEMPAETVVDAPEPEPQPPVEPVADAPAAEVPPAETPVEEVVVETPQVQFILPASGRVGEILRNYDGGYYSNHYRSAAIDILNKEGTAIYAAASGTVTLSSWYGGYGKCVIIDHGNGYSTLYGHFSSVDVSEGQTVTQGQRIGGMGSTGSSTANHVHFEVRVNNEAQPISHYFNVSSGDTI